MADLVHVSATVTSLAGGATLTTLRGQRPGPTLALLGGIHGDEDEGVLAVLRILRELSAAPLSGTVKAVARANPTAWAARSRVTPLDGNNLARCFPGNGVSPTDQLASAITSEVIDGASMLIDLHSAGTHYNMPLFCGFTRSGSAEQSRAAAIAFGAPLVWDHPRTGEGRSLSVATAAHIPAIYAECTGGGAIRGTELTTYVEGVLSVMSHIGMLPDSYAKRIPQHQTVYGDGDLDDGAQSSHHGLFVSTVRAGDPVRAKQEIGRVYDYEGALIEHIEARTSGMVMFLRNTARIQAGDVLFVMARATTSKGDS